MFDLQHVLDRSLTNPIELLDKHISCCCKKTCAQVYFFSLFFFFRSCPLIFQLIYFYAKYAALDRSDFLTFSDIHLLFVSCRLVSLCVCVSVFLFSLLSLLHHQNRTRNRQKVKRVNIKKKPLLLHLSRRNSSLFIRLHVDEYIFFLSFIFSRLNLSMW